MFHYTNETSFDPCIIVEDAVTDFYNLKNRAAGGRRYGYVTLIRKATNPDGSVAFRPEYQTTLDGARYQSSKRGAWAATEDEARAMLAKTVAGALKRYAKLAQDPASRIERRA